VSAACRSCGAALVTVFADLGMTPLANSYVEPGDANRMEPFYPLRAFVCDACLLVQLEEFESPQAIFGDYAYFSSFSESWVAHARRYCDHVAARFRLGPGTRVVEIASNDGYLLRHFRDRGWPVLGIEPAANVARAAEAAGIPTRVEFFGEALARRLVAEGVRADLLVANNVLAHVPALDDFVAGVATVLESGGLFTAEFPHLLRLIRETQFDTIYHEHFSYFSLLAVRRVFERHGLRVFDVDELPTHGGSLRLYVAHAGDAARGEGEGLRRVLAEERAAGLDTPSPYRGFAARVPAVKRALLRLLLDAQERGEKVAAYGAPAKGNTLLNYCGVGPDLVRFTVDKSPHKQGRLLPGSRIPVHAPERLREERPDLVLILPWNLRDEIVAQAAFVREWGGRFAVPIPTAEVFA
jgi:SAM-dependent methyltransferase